MKEVRMPNISMIGKRVLLTGGARGLGEMMMRTFSSQGATGVVMDVIAPNELPKGWIYIHCDLTDDNSTKNAFASIPEEFRAIDVLLANAGRVPSWSSIATTSMQVWDEVMALNSRALFATLKESFDLLRKPGGCVVVTASLNAWKGDGNIVPYVASKHAALGIVRSAAIDFGKSGIRVNAIAPGPIATEALLSRVKTRSAGDEKVFDEALERLAQSTALGRLATAEDVANTVLFLSSELANGITGQIVNIDAGVM